MITIEEVFTENPFIYYPYLADLWPVVSSILAQDFTREAIEKNQAGIFTIVKDKEVIGMTGFFLNNLPHTELSLRWHGIVPQYRKNGYSLQALKLVFERARYEFPDAQYMGEYVPVTDYNQSIIKYFTSIGFEQHSEPFPVDWSIYEMISFRANIDDFIQRHQ